MMKLTREMLLQDAFILFNFMLGKKKKVSDGCNIMKNFQVGSMIINPDSMRWPCISGMSMLSLPQPLRIVELLYKKGNKSGFDHCNYKNESIST